MDTRGMSAAAKKASMQQQLAVNGEGEEDDEAGPEEPQAKAQKTIVSKETTLIYLARTNAESEVPRRFDHIIVRGPPGFAAALTATVDQTETNSIQGLHKDKIFFFKKDLH